MKSILRHFAVIAIAFLVCSCASTKLKNSWKSPDYKGGPVAKIAVLVVDERGLVRKVLEGHTVGQLNAHGQPAFRVHEMLALDEIKADKNAAASRLRAEGADSILIMRLASSDLMAEDSRDVKVKPKAQSQLINGSWFDFYLMTVDESYMDVHGTLKQGLFIESSLYDLTSEKRLWSCVTKTIVKENSDKLELVKPLVAMIIQTMAADGMIR